MSLHNIEISFSNRKILKTVYVKHIVMIAGTREQKTRALITTEKMASAGREEL